MKSFQQYINEAFENDTLSTQLTKGNTGTYKKTGEYLVKNNLLQPKSSILSIGSGAIYNAQALHSSLGENHEHTVNEQEPNPGKRPANNQPKYSKMDGSDIPSDSHDVVLHHNVVNVVEPHIRDAVLHTSFRTVKEGGHIIIGSRGWKGDVDTVKNFEPADEDKAKWVIKKKKGGEVFHSYQKGFDGNELKDYAEQYAQKHNHTVSVKRLPGIASNAIHIHVIRKGS